MSKSENLENLLYGKELIVTDFAHTLIEGESYEKTAKRSLGKCVVKKAIKNRSFDPLRRGNDLRKHESMLPELNMKNIIEIVKDEDEDVAYGFGRKCAKYIDKNVFNFLSLCYNMNDRIQLALLSKDDRRVVEPTIDKLRDGGLPIHKYIVNQLLTVGGLLTDMVISYTKGVANWSGKAIWTAHDKLDAFVALINPYSPSQVIYINDDSNHETEIDRYMKDGGGTVLKGYDLSKFIAPTLI